MSLFELALALRVVSGSAGVLSWMQRQGEGAGEPGKKHAYPRCQLPMGRWRLQGLGASGQWEEQGLY